MDALPNIETMYSNLCDFGDPFYDDFEGVPLGGLSYQDPETGLRKDIFVDNDVLAISGIVYAHGAKLTKALQDNGAREIRPLEHAQDVIFDSMSDDKLVLGVVGYATAIEGIDYVSEGAGMTAIYDHLQATGATPSLVIDGGSRPGVLGLNSVIARMRGIPTFGVTPLQGLNNFAPHDHVAVCRETYKRREEVVGTLPNAVIAVAGGDGTRRECEAAARLGSALLLFGPKHYNGKALPSTYMQSAELRKAEEEKRLIVCKPDESITDKVDQLLDIATTTSKSNRALRKTITTSIFAEQLEL
jgi:predicted Rossmann-fold nucleotide-binding protein